MVFRLNTKSFSLSHPPSPRPTVSAIGPSSPLRSHPPNCHSFILFFLVHPAYPCLSHALTSVLPSRCRISPVCDLSSLSFVASASCLFCHLGYVRSVSRLPCSVVFFIWLILVLISTISDYWLISLLRKHTFSRFSARVECRARTALISPPWHLILISTCFTPRQFRVEDRDTPCIVFKLHPILTACANSQLAFFSATAFSADVFACCRNIGCVSIHSDPAKLLTHRGDITFPRSVSREVASETGVAYLHETESRSIPFCLVILLHVVEFCPVVYFWVVTPWSKREKRRLELKEGNENEDSYYVFVGELSIIYVLFCLNFCIWLEPFIHPC